MRGINRTFDKLRNSETVDLAQSAPDWLFKLKRSELRRPPIVKSSSANITSAPDRAATSAAARPAGPAPMISRSQCKKPRS